MHWYANALLLDGHWLEAGQRLMGLPETDVRRRMAILVKSTLDDRGRQ